MTPRRPQCMLAPSFLVSSRRVACVTDFALIETICRAAARCAVESRQLRSGEQIAGVKPSTRAGISRPLLAKRLHPSP